MRLKPPPSDDGKEYLEGTEEIERYFLNHLVVGYGPDPLLVKEFLTHFLETGEEFFPGDFFSMWPNEYQEIARVIFEKYYPLLFPEGEI